MEYRTHLYVHISIHIYKKEDKNQQSELYINVNWDEEDTQTRRLWMFQKCSTLEDTFGGEEVKNPQLAQILNQKECGMLSILFNLLSQFFFGLLSRWLLFFVFVCPPFNKKWRKKFEKKKWFSAFRWTNFWPIFREEEIVFWINLLWQYIWLRLGCRYCTVLTEASLFFVEIFFWNGELFLQDVWYSFHPLFPSLKISPCTPQ